MNPITDTELRARLDRDRRRIDEALDRQLPPAATHPAALHEGMRYTVLAGGKRLRGVVLLAACELAKGDPEHALPLACAVEMVHGASLILDDLPCMDNATLRRGKPALHLATGESNAILSAFALLNAAYAIVDRAPGIRDRSRRKIGEQLTRAVGGLCGGQTSDLESTGRRLDLETLEYIHSHKTGELFIAAAEIGATCAGAREKEVEALQRYAKNLGLAFQITDDLLDYSGNPEVTGKDAGLDREKTTFVDLCGIDGARRLAEELIDTSIEALEPFGRRAALLAALAGYVRSRDR